jgi:hypothetical protein
MLACAIAYVFVLQATLAATLGAALPPGAAQPFAELCLSQPADPHPAADGIDAEHVKAASRCSLCLIPAFGVLVSPTPNLVAVRAALEIAYEPRPPARIALADIASPHRARAPPAII